jgi:hypothetical protein
MSQPNPTPGVVDQFPITRTIFNLDNMEEVTLVKNVPAFVPAQSTADALARLGNDAAKFLQVINDGLAEAERQNVISDSNVPWLEEDEEGKQTPFSGTPADGKKVKTLILNLAKTVFLGKNWDKTVPPAEKKAAKESALAMIQSNDQIKNGLKQSAAGTL